MIISKTLQYVYIGIPHIYWHPPHILASPTYIGIPHTGSKSMNQWLMAHYQGEWYGDHHDWQVPAFAKNFLIFTVVRSPYQRAVSGYFAMPRNSSILKDSEIIEELVKWIVTRVITGEAVVIPPQVVNPYSPYRGFF